MQQGVILCWVRWLGAESSISVFKTKDFDPANPMYKVKMWDVQENETEQLVDISKIDPNIK